MSMKNKLLPWIITLSALSVSVSAAFYSVSGLGKMFAGASVQVMVLAGSLEFAKLVTASLLYQYWNKLNIGLKAYLSIATLILILITSAGIYGFLSSAYQETSFKVQNQDKNIEILDKEISIVNTEIKNYENQIQQKSNRLSQLTSIRTNLQSTQDVLIGKSKSTNSVRNQIKDVDSEIKRMDQEISVLNDSISSKNSRISIIEKDKMGISSNADIAKEVGPLKYIAKLTGSSIDSVVNWYIIILMLVFDPLAISLVIAANFAFEMSKNDVEEVKQKKNKNNKEKMEFFKKMWKKLFTKKEKKAIVETIIDEPKIDLQKEEEPIIVHHEDSIKNESEDNQLVYEESIEVEVNNIGSDEIHVDFKEQDAEIEINEPEDVHNDAEENKDKYIDHIQLENQKVLRDRFRENPGAGASDILRANRNGQIDPTNLR